MSEFFGANYILPGRIKAHLFIICPNNSGSTFLKNALATSVNTWNLEDEGHHTFGFQGPSTKQYRTGLIFTTHHSWLQAFTNPTSFHWEGTKRAWYFQAKSKSKDACVFVEKSPPFLLVVPQLAKHFVRARFLFVVRDPYAVAEGIGRKKSRAHPKNRTELLKLAAQHICNLFRFQRRNLESFSDQGVFFTYEQLCSEPQVVEEMIKAMIPELNDLNLDQSLAVKGSYHERLRNMNEQQIDRLSPKDFQTLNEVFKKEENLLEFFDYSLRERT